MACTSFLPCRFRRFLGLSLGIAFVLLCTACAHAQFGAPPTTQVHDPDALKPPAGARVALVEFEDLECPDCADANPLMMEAAAKYNIPWIRHDFPLPFHNWSFQAAVNARWFDTKSQKLGDGYRNAVFDHQRTALLAHQPGITTPAELTQFTQNYAQSNHIAMPFAVDPMGKLAAAVKADYALGQRIDIEHTPTIWVVTNGSDAAPPFVEVVDRTRLFQLIDQALAETRR
jgi:protein-disulfide isomerase